MTSKKKCPGCETIVLREDANIIANQKDGLTLEYVCNQCMTTVDEALGLLKDVFKEDYKFMHMGSICHASAKWENK